MVEKEAKAPKISKAQIVSGKKGLLLLLLLFLKRGGKKKKKKKKKKIWRLFAEFSAAQRRGGFAQARVRVSVRSGQRGAQRTRQSGLRRRRRKRTPEQETRLYSRRLGRGPSSAQRNGGAGALARQERQRGLRSCRRRGRIRKERGPNVHSPRSCRRWHQVCGRNCGERGRPVRQRTGEKEKEKDEKGKVFLFFKIFVFLLFLLLLQFFFRFFL